jgi:hypothetical protein
VKAAGATVGGATGVVVGARVIAVLSCDPAYLGHHYLTTKTLPSVTTINAATSAMTRAWLRCLPDRSCGSSVAAGAAMLVGEAPVRALRTAPTSLGNARAGSPSLASKLRRQRCPVDSQ